MNILQESWFSVPVWTTILNHDNEALEKYCNDLILQDKKATLVGAAKDGGWQSEKIYHDVKNDNEIYEDLFNRIYEKCKILVNTLKLDKRFDITISDSWFNKSYSKSWFERHSHSGSILSGVYYVKAPQNCGKITFYNPCDFSVWWNETFFPGSDFFYSSINYSPIEGGLILFPSWLTHSVEENKSNSDRISIAFNVSPIHLDSINLYKNDNIQKN